MGLIGPSGCGKTTLIRILLGIREPTAGEVEVLGGRPVDSSPAQRARIGYLPQLPSLFPNLSLWNNLRFAAALYGVRRRGRRRRLHQRARLRRPRRRPRASCCAHASGGMQRRLALAAALVHDPELILLDEPTAGIDPILRERFWTYFRSLRDDGRTLIVSTQYVGEAADCDLVAVMCAGRVLALDTPDGLRRRAFGGDLIDVRPERGWLDRRGRREAGRRAVRAGRRPHRRRRPPGRGRRHHRHRAAARPPAATATSAPSPSTR